MTLFSTHNKRTLAVVTALVTAGTLYSVSNNTFLDTSNPLLAHLPHPAHGHTYFASKKTVVNQYFVKYAWAWTSGAFWALWLTTQPADVLGFNQVGKWFGATFIWGAFASWFFGPSLSARLLGYSGAECAIIVPPPPAFGASSASSEPHLVNVPIQYCSYRTTVGPQTHPELFVLPDATYMAQGGMLDPTFKATPRLYRGHDISGHTFLLSLSVLFLVDALVRARKGRANAASMGVQVAAWGLVGLWLVMLTATAVYFHTWEEKATGLAVGVIGFLVSQYPFESSVSTPVLTKKMS